MPMRAPFIFNLCLNQFLNLALDMSLEVWDNLSNTTLLMVVMSAGCLFWPSLDCLRTIGRFWQLISINCETMWPVKCKDEPLGQEVRRRPVVTLPRLRRSLRRFSRDFNLYFCGFKLI